MLAVVYALIAAVLITISGIAAKKALIKEHSLDFTLFQVVLGLCLVSLLGFKVNFHIKYDTLGLIYLAATLGTLSLYFSMKILKRMEISLFNPIGDLNLILILGTGYLFLGEGLGYLRILGVLLVVTGAYLLNLHKENLIWSHPISDARKSPQFYLVILTLVLSAASVIVGRFILRGFERIDVFTYLFFVYLSYSVNQFLLFTFLHHEPVSVSLRGLKENFGWTFTATLTKVLSNYFYATAVASLYIVVAESIKNISTPLSILLGGRVFKEDRLVWRALASAVMLLGVALTIL